MPSIPPREISDWTWKGMGKSSGCSESKKLQNPKMNPKWLLKFSVGQTELEIPSFFLDINKNIEIFKGFWIQSHLKQKVLEYLKIHKQNKAIAVEMNYLALANS